MIRDPRYATLLARSSRFKELYQFIETTLATRSTADWSQAFARAELPFAMVNSFDALLEDEHLQATDFWKTLEHPTEGTMRMPRVVPQFSETPGSIRRHAPNLGEHTEEVFREFEIDV